MVDFSQVDNMLNQLKMENAQNIQANLAMDNNGNKIIFKFSSFCIEISLQKEIIVNFNLLIFFLVLL